jgi:HlyD family secretion protein
LTISLFGLGAATLVFALTGRSGPDEPTGVGPTVRAERRDLTQALVEPGTLQAARAITLASEIRSNRAKIVSLASDGAWVRPGEVVVRFDRTPFEEERAKALAEVRDAEATEVRAEQERKLQVAKAEEALESARHTNRLAELNLEAFEKGSGALSVREAEVRSAEIEAEMRRAREDLGDMQRMLERGFVSQSEVEQQRARVDDLERQGGLEADRLRTAREIHFPRDLERARTQVREAGDSVARAEGVLYYTHEYYRAALESAARKVDAAREALRSIDEQLEKTEVKTPLEGFLVLQDIPLESGKRKPQVGDSVWSGVPIATVPDLSRMVVTTRIREVDLHRIALDLHGRISVDAYPDLVLDGAIRHIGSLAESKEDSPWKFFTVSLDLQSSDQRLRPGMSVQVAIELAEARDVIVVPIDAVFPDGDRHVVYVREGRQVIAQEIALGMANETHVEVRAGLDPGEEILLSAPTGSVDHRALEDRGPQA